MKAVKFLTATDAKNFELFLMSLQVSYKLKIIKHKLHGLYYIVLILGKVRKQ
jgi:hypothetical protein